MVSGRSGEDGEEVPQSRWRLPRIAQLDASAAAGNGLSRVAREEKHASASISQQVKSGQGTYEESLTHAPSTSLKYSARPGSPAGLPSRPFS